MTQQEKVPKFRRWRYLISARYQLKYIGLILLCMFFTVAVCAFTVYFTGMSIFAEKLSNVYPQGRFVVILNSVNYSIMANIFLLIPVIAAIGLYLSHKIAGPVYRIERYLTDMAAGKLTSQITLRKGDELVSLAGKINVLTDSLRATIINQRTSLDKILAELEAVKKQADSRGASIAEIDSNIEKINEEIRVLERELDRFKM